MNSIRELKAFRWIDSTFKMSYYKKEIVRFIY